MTDVTIRVEGAEEVLQVIQRLGKALDSSKFWRSAFGPLLKMGKRFAIAGSPVDTGSYAEAHRVAIKGKVGEMFIDPFARNTVSGARVIDYAPFVEMRENVYGQTFGQVNRLAVRAVMKEIRNVNK